MTVSEFICSAFEFLKNVTIAEITIAAGGLFVLWILALVLLTGD